MNGHDVIKEARSWIGVPFMHQGRSRTGIDCAGFVAEVAKALNLEGDFVDLTNYARQPTTLLMKRYLQRYMDEIRNWDDMRAGDVIHFRFSILPQHAAFYTGPDDNRIIHAYNGGHRKAVIQTGFTGKWPTRMDGLFRFKGL